MPIKFLNDVAVDSSVLYVDTVNDRVGIGTTNPSQKLEVNGAVLAGDYRGSAQIYLTSPDSWIFRSTGGSERMRITSAGNVGINTTSPLTKLQITAANASSPTANIFLDIDGSNTPGMGGQIIFGASTSGTLTDYIARIQGVRSALDNGSSDLHFQTTHVSTATGPTTKMTILSDGNVGIGRSSSITARLFVQGPVDTATISTSSTPAARINNGGAISNWIGSNGYNYGYIQSIQDDGSNNLKPLSLQPLGGNVGIGTTSPSTKLHIEGDGSIIRLQNNNSDVNGTFIDFRDSTGTRTGYLGTTGASDDMFLFTQASKPIRFFTNATERARITGAGNVGIGTTAPTTKLNVSGSIAVSSGSYLSFIDSNLNYNKIGRNTSVGGIQITTGGNATMNLLDNGNVGIGTASPGAKLDVVGSARFNNLLATNSTNGAAKAFIHVASSAGAAKFKVYKNVNTTNGYAYFRIDQAYDYGNNDQMIQEAVYQRRTTTKNVKFKYEGDVATTDDVYLEFYELTDGTVEAWICHDDYAQVGVSITYFESTGDTYPTPSAGTPTGTLIHSTNPDTETPNWNSYQGDGYFAGNVGIGTTNPAVPLHVDGWARLNGSLQLDGSNRQIMAIDNTSLLLGTNNTERIRITSTGNVGIGTTSPGKKLDVNGDTIFRGELVIDGDSSVHSRIKQTSSYLEIVGNNTDSADGTRMWIGTGQTDQGFYVNASGYSFRDTSSNTRMSIIGSSGNVGIGTTSPSALLDIASGVGSTEFTGHQILMTRNGNNEIYAQGASSVLALGTNGSEDMRITSSGNVGIGTTSPGAKLEVAGDSILDKKSILRLPAMNMGSGGITDEYLVIARKYDGVIQNATGIIGKIIFSRGGASAGNNPSEYYINIQCAYNSDALNNLTYTGTEIFNSLDVIDISGTDYYALKVRTNGGGDSANRFYAEGLLMDDGDSNIFTRVRSSDASVTVVSTGSMTPTAEVNGSGITNYVAKWSDADTITNSVIYDNGTNVGIGLTNPVDRLDLYDSDDNVGMYFHTATSGTGGGNGLRVGQNNANAFVWNYEATPLSLATGGTARLTINATGGIRFNTGYGAGTLVTDASGNITVSSSGGAGGPYLPLSAGSSYPLTGDLYLDDDSGATPSLYFKNGANNFWRYLMESGGDFSIKEGTSTRLTFQAGGNVGIGTTSPSKKLHVTGAAQVDNGGLLLGGTSSVDGNNPQLRRANSSNDLRIATAGSDRMTILGTGNVGIGTTNPTGKLEVRQAANNGNTGAFTNTHVKLTASATADNTGFVGITAATSTANNYGYSFGAQRTSGGVGSFKINYHNNSAAGTNRFIIDQNGNVGIGTTSPSQKLQVEGNSWIKGIYYDTSGDAGASGQVLSSTATGTTWIDGTAIPGVPDGSGTAGKIVMWQDSDTLTDSKITQTAGSETNYVDIDFANVEDLTITGDSSFSTFTVNAFDSVNFSNIENNFNVGSGDLAIATGDSSMSLGTTTADSNTLTVGYQTTRFIGTGNVGIGTTSPQEKLHVQNYTTGESHQAIFKGGAVTVGDYSYISLNNGYSTEYNKEVRLAAVAELSTSNKTGFAILTSPDANGASGHERLRVTADGNVGIGTTSPTQRLDVNGDIAIKNATQLSFNSNNGTLSVASHAGQLDLLSSSIFINYSSNVGIGTTTPSYLLEVSGSAAKSTGTTWINTSDERTKENIQNYTKGLNDIVQLQPRVFDYNGKGSTEKSKENIGLIAQEVIDVYPEAIGTFKAKLDETDAKETDIYNLDFHSISISMINAIKELNEKVKILEDKIQTLENQ